MRTLIGTFLALAIFCQHAFCTDNFLGECIDSDLDVVYSYYQKNWIMGLSDGSCWKLFPMAEKRKQTWTEWWNSTQPKEWSLSDDYFFDPYQWKGKYTIQVFEARNSLSSNCKYILTNQTTGQKVFAEFIPYGSKLVPKIEYAMKLAENSQTIQSEVLGSYHFFEDLLVLGDNSIWKLYLMNENSQSWTEWWNSVEIDQPDEMFVSLLKEWKSTDTIQVHRAQFDDWNVHQKYKVTKPTYEIFLLENKTRGKVAYATSVNLKDFIELSLKQADKKAKKAYLKGHVDGYQNGYRDGKQRGFQDGYQKGYREGRQIIQFDEMN